MKFNYLNKINKEEVWLYNLLFNINYNNKLYYIYFTKLIVFICCIYQIKMNYNKNYALEIRQVKVAQLALPPTGPRLELKSPDCLYTADLQILIFF